MASTARQPRNLEFRTTREKFQRENPELGFLIWQQFVPNYIFLMCCYDVPKALMDQAARNQKEFFKAR